MDGKPQKVIFFEGGSVQRTVPIELSLLFDCSRTALSSGALDPGLFVEGLLKEFPNASIALYGFRGGLERLVPLTRDQEALNQAMGSPMFVHPVGTFLLDHISRVELETLSTGGVAIRMLAVFSERRPDSGATSSAEEQRRYQRAIAIAQQTAVSIYPVWLKSPLAVQTTESTPAPARTSTVGGPQLSQPDPTPGLRAVGDFISLGAATGGEKTEALTGGNVLPDFLEWMAKQLRYEYAAGFEVPVSGEKERHKVKVVMRNKKRGKIDGDTHTLVY